MAKKINILLLLVILPIILIQLYARYFEFAGNFLEKFRNYFKLGFLIASLLGTGWLTIVSRKEKSYIWLAFSVVLLVLLLIYLYLAVAIINTSF